MKYTAAVLVVIAIAIGLAIALAYNGIESFQESVTYIGKIMARDDILCDKNLRVDGALTVPELCLDGECITHEDLNFMPQLPGATEDNYCIGETCVSKRSMSIISKLRSLNITEQFTFKAVSSGEVEGGLWGEARFYFQGKEYTGLPTSRGFNILIIKKNGSIKQFRTFDTHDSPRAREEMIGFIKSLENGVYVLVAVAGEAEKYDRESVTLYDEVISKLFGLGWTKNYKINSDGSDTKIPSDWLDKNNPAAFPNDEVSALDVEGNLKASLYKHGYGKGSTWHYFKGEHSAFFNDEVSSMLITKDDGNIMSSVYEALMLVGSNGKTFPNYYGSYALIGRKGMSPGQAIEQTINANADHSNSRTVSVSKNFKPSDVYVKLDDF
jgi:hypothetical protein